MIHRLILKDIKFQFPPPKHVGTVVKNIFGGPLAPPPPSTGRIALTEMKLEYESDIRIDLLESDPDFHHFVVLKRTFIYSFVGPFVHSSAPFFPVLFALSFVRSFVCLFV